MLRLTLKYTTTAELEWFIKQIGTRVIKRSKVYAGEKGFYRVHIDVKTPDKNTETPCET